MFQMVDASAPPQSGHSASVAADAGLRQQYLRAFRWMALARALDDKLASLYRAGKIHGGVFLGRGQEAVSVAVGMALRQGDVFAPLIRDGAGRLAFGETLLEALQTCLGSPQGPMRGRDGNVHRGRPRDGLLPMISHLGATIAVVNGILMARKIQNKTGSVGAACIGEGATSTGAFHEAVNQAAIERLPLVLVVADNQYAYSTPNYHQYACQSLVDRAAGYGIEGHQMDGTDLSSCLAVVGQAVENARNGGGPQLVVARLLRLCGHGEHDDASYIDPKLKNSHFGRDCLVVAEEHLLRNGWAAPAVLEQMRAEIAKELEETVAAVQREGAPDPFHERWIALATNRLTEGDQAALE